MKGFANVCMIGDELALSLGDGHEMYFPLPLLRRACPCAACQGEPDAMGRVLRPLVKHGAGAFELKRFEMVGGYGIQLYWTDGHGSGIYSLDYLEKLSNMAGE